MHTEDQTWAVRVLGELGAELELLWLRRVDADQTFVQDRSAKIFQYAIVKRTELRRRVRVEGHRTRRVPLSDIFEHTAADPALGALRTILSTTFEEATTPRQEDCILEDIRFPAAAALVPCNHMIEMMELEPVMMPTRRRFVNGADTYAEEDAEL